MSRIKSLLTRAICVAAVCISLTSLASADPFVGSRTYTFRTDLNIGDGLQVQTEIVDGTIATADSHNYVLDFTNPDALPVAMTRDGDWLKLQAPQPFDADATILEAAVVADDDGGAMILYVHDEFAGASPDDYSISYSVWSDSSLSVTADDLAGQWELVEYGHPNLLHDSSGFFTTTEIITVTSLGGNRISAHRPSQGTFTMVISGNELTYEGPAPWHDGRMLMTRDHMFFGVIGVEENDPTDIALGIGYLTLIPEPATLGLLLVSGLALLRRGK